MLNPERHCPQWFFRYIHSVTTGMLHKLKCTAVYCHTTCCFLPIFNTCCEMCYHNVRILSIRVLLGCHEFGLRIVLGAQGRCQISTRWEDLACFSAFLLTLRVGLEIEPLDFKAENSMMTGDFLCQVVEIVIRGIPTVLDINVKCLFMSLGRILLKGSISTTLLNPIRH